MSKIKFRLNKKWRLNKVCVLHKLELNKSQPKSGRLQQYSSPSPSPSTVARVGGCLISEAFPRHSAPSENKTDAEIPPDLAGPGRHMTVNTSGVRANGCDDLIQTTVQRKVK